MQDKCVKFNRLLPMNQTEDAYNAQEIAEQELAKERSEYNEERARRERRLRERQRNAKYCLQRQMQEQEKSQGEIAGGSICQQETDQQDEQDDEAGSEDYVTTQQVEADRLRTLTMRVKSITGIGDAQALRSKLEHQGEVLRKSQEISKDNQVTTRMKEWYYPRLVDIRRVERSHQRYEGK